MAVPGDDPLNIRQRCGHCEFSTSEIYIREAEAIRDRFGEPFPPLPAELLWPDPGLASVGQKPNRRAPRTENTWLFGGVDGDSNASAENAPDAGKRAGRAADSGERRSPTGANGPDSKPFASGSHAFVHHVAKLEAAIAAVTRCLHLLEPPLETWHVRWTAMWQAIDTQPQLDELDAVVCWEDSQVVEFHGGSVARPYFPTDVSRSGAERPDVHVLVATPCSRFGALLELCFIHCDRLAADAFDRLHLRGRVDGLRRVEIESDGETIVRCARLIFRWHASLEDAPRFSASS